MIGRICLLLEALSIVICLHHLYGKKFKLDIATISLLAIDMIMMTTIDYFGWPSTLSIIIYPIIAVYCGVEFGFEWKKIIINNILYMIIVSVCQLAIMWMCHYVFRVNYVDDWLLLLANAIVLTIVSIIPKRKLNELSMFIDNRERIYTLIIVICIVVAVFCLFGYKDTKQFALYQSLLLIGSIVLICVLMAKVNKLKIKEKEVETELRMHKLYEDSFKGLIENIRIRQHEFDNHINAIYSQHYMYHTYEDLVNGQRDYCENIREENRYNKIVSKGNPVIICFLYGKFIEVEKLGIKVSYQINIDELNIQMPIYKMVEILGNLIKNAVEAMQGREGEKRLHVSLLERENSVEIEVRNVSEFISHRDISNFFVKGYSQKGNDRGLGLYNVKKICDEYNFTIICNNSIIKEENWLVFRVIGERI